MNRVDDQDRCQWYVVHVKPKQDTRAESNLLAWGLETLAPKLRQIQAGRTGGIGYVVSSLFPGYLFSRFNVETHLTKVKRTRGVHSVVGFGEYATPVDDSLIGVIRNRIEDDGYVHPQEPRAGDRVEVVAGPFRSVQGIFEHSLNGNQRVSVLLTSIEAFARIQVARALVRPITPVGIAP